MLWREGVGEWRHSRVNNVVVDGDSSLRAIITYNSTRQASTMHKFIDINMCIESIHIIKLVLGFNLYCTYTVIPMLMVLSSSRCRFQF